MASRPSTNDGRKPATRVTFAERRDSILKAATRVFVRSGYAGARTKDIAIEAGINEALIYRHFASKEELFDAAVTDPLEQWLQGYRHIGPLVANAADAKTQLHLLEQSAAEYMSHINEVLPLLGIALFGSGGHGPDFYNKRFAPLIDSWAKRTQIAMPKDAPGGRMDQRFLACAGIGIMVFVAADAHFRGVPFDARTAGKQLAQMMLPLFEHRGGQGDAKAD